MKKLLAILVLGSFVACNSGESTTATDSTATSTETVAPAYNDTTSGSLDTTGTGTGL